MAMDITTGDWPPYINKESNSGILTDIIKASLIEANDAAIIKYYPWKRVEAMINDRNAVSYGWSYGQERASKWSYSLPLYQGMDVFIVHKNSDFSYTKSEDLGNYKIGHVNGFGIPEKLAPHWDQLNIVKVNSVTQILKMILKDRVDVVILNPLVARKIIEETIPVADQKKFKFLTKSPVEIYELHAVCAKTSKNCTDKLKIINRGLKLIKDKNIYQSIIKRYEQYLNY